MILWFWEVLRGFNREERALFLQFVTGTSKVRTYCYVMLCYVMSCHVVYNVVCGLDSI